MRHGPPARARGRAARPSADSGDRAGPRENFHNESCQARLSQVHESCALVSIVKVLSRSGPPRPARRPMTPCSPAARGTRTSPSPTLKVLLFIPQPLGIISRPVPSGAVQEVRYPAGTLGPGGDIQAVIQAAGWRRAPDAAPPMPGAPPAPSRSVAMTRPHAGHMDHGLRLIK